MTRIKVKIITPLVCALILALSSTLSFSAYANDSVATVASQAQTVRVGFDVQPGMYDYTETGALKGYAVDYLSRVSTISGLKFEYVEAEWADQLSMLESGDIDIVFHAKYTQDRAELYEYSTLPIGSSYTSIYARSDDDRFYYEDFSALDGQVIGTIPQAYENISLANYAAKGGFSYSTVAYANNLAAYQALVANEIDLIAITHECLPNDVKCVADFDVEPLFIIANKGNTELIDAINEAIEQIKILEPHFQSDTYASNYLAYGEEAQMSLTREEADFIESHPTLTIGVPDSRPPISFYDAKTQSYSGVLIDLLDSLSARIGIEFSYQPLALNDSPYDAIHEDRYDLVAPVTETSWLGEPSGIYATIPLFDASLSFVAKNGFVYDTDSPYTVGITKDQVGAFNILKSTYPNWQVKTYEDQNALFEALLRDEVKIAAHSTYTISYLLQKPAYDNLGLIPGIATSYPYCIGASTSIDTTLASLLNKGISAQSNADVEYAIVIHTGPSSYNYTFLDFIVRYRTIITFCLAVIAIAVITILLRRHFMKRSNTLMRKADTDGLSGLLNRSAFERICNEKLLAAELDETRTAAKSAFFLYDLDNFKQVNDVLGHIEGDRLLVRVSEVLKSCFRDSDSVARLGGDEFAVFLQNLDKDLIDKRAQDSVAAIATVTSEMNDKVEVSASLGVSIAPEDGETFGELYRTADMAMYEAKKSGKNIYRYYRKDMVGE